MKLQTGGPLYEYRIGPAGFKTAFAIGMTLWNEISQCERDTREYAATWMWL